MQGWRSVRLIAGIEKSPDKGSSVESPSTATNLLMPPIVKFTQSGLCGKNLVRFDNWNRLASGGVFSRETAARSLVKVPEHRVAD